MVSLSARSALADRHLKTAKAYWESDGLTLQESPDIGMVKLQRAANKPAFLEAVSRAKLVLPSPGEVTSSEQYRCLWLTPNEWLFIVPAEQKEGLTQYLVSSISNAGLITDISDSRAVMTIVGPTAWRVLGKASAVDWHPDKFAVGRCAVTRFIQVPALVHRVDELRYELFVDRSYGCFVWDWLVDAAGEFCES